MMTLVHQPKAGDHVDHGEATRLFPVDELSAVTHQHRDAQVVLESLDSADVLAVAPTGFASSYYLHRHPLTVVEIESLPEAIETAIARESGVEVADFEVIRIGTCQREITDRSLLEF
jgi:hypothetical protein